MLNSSCMMRPLTSSSIIKNMITFFLFNHISLTCEDTFKHFYQFFFFSHCIFALRCHVSSVAWLEFNLWIFIMVRNDLWSTNMRCIQMLLDNSVIHVSSHKTGCKDSLLLFHVNCVCKKHINKASETCAVCI